jgi:hypothetical protein
LSAAIVGPTTRTRRRSLSPAVPPAAAAADNSIRNALFGASLTEGEKAAYEATTVDPSMTPAEVRRNLSRRVEVARDILRRRVGRLYSVYNQGEVEAALGEYMGELLPADESEAPEEPPGDDPAGGGQEPENFWPGVVGEDGKPLGPEGGYGKDPETGEGGRYGRTTADRLST